MNEAAIVAAIAGPVAIAMDRGLSWLTNRGKSRADNNKVDSDSAKVDAEAGLAVDKRWENWADNLDAQLKTQGKELGTLRDRVVDLEDALYGERRRVRELLAEVERVKGIARSLALHAGRLREELVAAGGPASALPAEVEAALTTLEPTT